MGMTPEKFFDAFVEGNYADCQENPGCVRRAFNAAVSASHLADHCFEYYRRHDPKKVKGFSSIGKYVESLSQRTAGCFRDIRSISNAYKHLYTSTDSRPAIHSSVSSAGAIESVTFTNEVGELTEIQEEMDSNTKDSNFRTKVIFTKKNGTRVEFLATLKTVIEFWRNFCFGS